jgi:hypothetical protein
VNNVMIFENVNGQDDRAPGIAAAIPSLHQQLVFLRERKLLAGRAGLAFLRL